MLAELDMLKDASFRGLDEADGESFNGSPKGSINLSLDDLSKVSSADSVPLHTYISDTGVCNDHDKTCPLYSITVHGHNLNTEKMWKPPAVTLTFTTSTRGSYGSKRKKA